MTRIRRISQVLETSCSKTKLKKFGLGDVAFIRKRTSEQAKAVFRQSEDIPTGTDIFSAHAADGTLFALTDTQEAAKRFILSEDLVEVSVH